MNHMTILRAAAAATVAALLTGTAPLPASATFAGTNGRITFHRDDDNGFYQVWAANPDLSQARQLTSDAYYNGFAVWAPDGSRIAFDSDRAGLGANDVFTMRPDGSDIRKVTDSVGFSGDPAYSPDGQLIAFDANRGVTIGPDFPSSLPDLSVYVVNADGTGMRRVTTAPAGASDTEPRFSPDGTQLLFTRFRGPVNDVRGERVGKDMSAVFVVNLDGSGERRVTGWGLKTGQADWSPDGRRIVYEMACCRLGAGGIYTVNVDGSGFAAVVNGHGVTGIGNSNALQIDGYYDPVWSPDGTRIIAGHELLADEGTFTVGLVFVDPANGRVEWASSTVNGEHQPDWGSAPLQ